MLKIVAIVLMLVGFLVSSGLGGLSIFFATRLTQQLWLSMMFGTALIGILMYGVGVLFAGWLQLEPQRLGLSTAALSLAVLAVVAGVTVFQPTKYAKRQRTASETVRFWQLNTGSRIAYQHMIAAQPTQRTPIVYLHGGPGGYAVDTKIVEVLAPLTQQGFEVYVYDQIGGGLSSRLKDANYSIERHIADLEAIRQTIKSDKLILIGQSWGGRLAAEYAATYPNQIEQLIFTNPGELTLQTRGVENERTFSTDKEQALNTLKNNPRMVLTVLLASLISPQVALQLTSENQLDAWFDEVADFAVLASYYNIRLAQPTQGLAGSLAAIIISRELGKERNTVERLKKLKIPVLILKGEADYVGWGITRAYRETFKNSRLLVLSKAGHASYAEQPELYRKSIIAFLQGQNLPLEPYTSDKDPFAQPSQ